VSNEIRFLTRNKGKLQELEALIDRDRYVIIGNDHDINEIQTNDSNLLVRDKVLKAFKIIGRPLIVDHTGLSFDLLGGFPSGLTSVFYDLLQPDGIAKVIGNSPDRRVTATTLIGYCDGRQIYSFEGKVRGTVASTPRGTEGFQWDTIFIPDGYDQTFAELGNKKKNEISMRRLAFDAFAEFLRERSL
jgi:XTP/dITP diphosphohydrolase